MSEPIRIVKLADLFYLRIAAREWLKARRDDPNAERIRSALVSTNESEEPVLLGGRALKAIEDRFISS